MCNSGGKKTSGFQIEEWHSFKQTLNETLVWTSKTGSSELAMSPAVASVTIKNK